MSLSSTNKIFNNKVTQSLPCVTFTGLKGCTHDKQSELHPVITLIYRKV